MIETGFERIFEIWDVYQDEEHNKSKYLNKYISINFRFGFIKNEYDLV
jgi:aspartyl/asparaginyl-tRNA synthetase